MSIEKVLLKVTLKAGKNVWEEGTVLTAPLPPDILDEIYRNTGTVAIVEGDARQSQTKMTFVAQRVQEQATSMTTMVPEPPPQLKDIKPKPKLIRRRA